MSHVSFDYSALHYLNLWLASDRKLHEALSDGHEDPKLKALADAAVVYRVARTLPKIEPGEGIPRFKPVLEIIDRVSVGELMADRVGKILFVRNQIRERYNCKHDVLSPTTKFLWLKFKSPIIIYDSRARKALSTKAGDLATFYSAWQSQFSENRDVIDAACRRLVTVRQYSIDTEQATEEYVADIASQEWFKERVFDIYLWHVGGRS